LIVEVYHFVRYDQPGRRQSRALCGKSVDRYTEHSTEPTCPDCKRIREEENAQTADSMFGSEPAGAPVHSTLLNTLAGYRPKGARS
jgi:hypothetical protein